MAQYLIILSEHGEDFDCYRIEDKAQVHVNKNKPSQPTTIRDAINCKNRHQTLEYIKFYLHESQLIGTDSTHEIYETIEAEVTISLAHKVCKELPKNNQKISAEQPIQYQVKKPGECIQFINNRQQRYQNNVNKGERYQQTPWYNPSFFLLLLEYLFHKCKNRLAASTLGQYIHWQPDHFCEEFDEGCRQVQMNRN